MAERINLEPSGTEREPSRALVAKGRPYGAGCVVEYTGEDLYNQIEDAGLTELGDLGLDDAPEGFSIWEGFYRGYQSLSTPDGIEYDTEPVGAFRKLTPDEWDQLRREGRLWPIPEEEGEGDG